MKAINDNSNNRGRVERFSSDSLTNWMTDNDRVFFGDVLAESEGARMDVTFIRWSEGESGPFDFPLPYDEVFVVIKGSFTIRLVDREVTAREGEVLYLWAGISGTYYAYEDAEIVAITNPPYRQALRSAGFGGELDALRQTEL